MSVLKEHLEKVKLIEDDVDQAVEVMEFWHEILGRKDFKEADALLKEYHQDFYDNFPTQGEKRISLLISVLTATLTACSFLEERTKLFNLGEKLLKAEGKDPLILKGLDTWKRPFFNMGPVESVVHDGFHG